MKYVPDGELDCQVIRSKRICIKCLHYSFCSRQKDTIVDQTKVLKSEQISPWHVEDEGAGKPQKLGGAEF